MSKKNAATYISISRRFIYSRETMEHYRVDKSDFTRRRKLPFEMVVLSMLKLLRKSLALELHQIFGDLNLLVKKVSASAFVQSRKKIKPQLFYDLQSLIAREFYKDNDENVKLYKGMRLLSFDGSTLNLPFSASMAEQFGIYRNQRETGDVIIGRVSVLYDLLNEIVIDGLLRPFSEGKLRWQGSILNIWLKETLL